MGTEVSGRAFLGLLLYVREHHGEPMLARIVDKAGAETRRVFDGRIGKLHWYPYAAFTAFLEAAERTLPQRLVSPCFELGRQAGRRDIGTVLKVYAAIASPERLIRSCRLVWPSYYRNAGRMEAIEWRSENTVLRIFDFPEMHRLHCKLMEGWMISTMESLGLRVGPDARQTKVAGQGAPYHEFWCTWSR
jgi:hypothetical protein